MTLRKRLTAAALSLCISALSCTTVTEPAISAKAIDEVQQSYAEAMVNLINDVRIENGLSELPLLPELQDLAMLRTEEIVITHSHERPDGSKWYTLLKENGFASYSFASENLVYGNYDPSLTLKQQMESPKHKENILTESLTHIGVGYLSLPETEWKHYWVVFFVDVRDGEYPRIFDNQYIPARDLGDPNGSNSINASDATAILQYSAAEASGVSKPVSRSFKKAADVNQDGSVDSVDASIILSYTSARGSGEKVTLEDFIW